MASHSTSKFLVIKTGGTLPSLLDSKGDFEDWILAGMGVAREAAILCDVCQGDPLPDPETVAGVVITGSHAMVTEHQAWSEQTAAWLALAVERRLPILGICYGHQLLAYALGGEVADNPRGREYGTVQIYLNENAHRDPLFANLPSPLRLHAGHVQTVLRLPPRAISLATSDMDNYQAFSIGGYAWGIQFHPEFDAQVVREYIRHEHDILLAEGRDPGKLIETSADTPFGTQILQRFAGLVIQR